MTANTKECSLGTRRCSPRSFTEVVHCVARHSGVDAHRLAELLEVDYPTFIRWTEPNGLSTMPARKLVPLAQHTGRFDHLSWLAADAGLVLAPRVSSTGTGDRLRELLDISAYLGQLAALDRDASLDGRIDDDERVQLRAAVQRLGREVHEYAQALDAPAGDRV